jgi:tetratricopeptide (TPR) repeat protein
VEMTVECMAAGAALASLEQRPDALELAMQALNACRSLKAIPSALELRILSSLACAQLVAGHMSDAIGTFEEAIKRTDPVVDMRRLGRLLGNAGVAYRELGQLEKAVRCSTRAVALFQTLDDAVSLAREENNLGYYLIGSGDLTSARRHLERSLDLFEKTNLRTSRGLLLLSLCQLCLAEGDLEHAIAYADAAIEAGESQDEPWSIADARMWKGRLLERRGEDVGADDEFQRALAILENAGMTERLLECHAGYAEFLERRGDLPGAYEQVKAAFHIAARTS